MHDMKKYTLTSTEDMAPGITRGVIPEYVPASACTPVQPDTPALPITPTSDASDCLGLRERKRRATHSAIENAALDLLERGGYEAVTIEAICREVGISMRTFFNYFPSKDAAIVGEGPSGLTTTQVADLLDEHAPDLLAGLVAALMTGERACSGDRAVEHRRRKVLAADPVLAWQHVRLGMDFGHLLRTVAAEYLSSHPEARRLDLGIPVRCEADLILSVAFVAVRHAFSLPGEEADAASIDVEAALDRIRDVLGITAHPGAP